MLPRKMPASITACRHGETWFNLELARFIEGGCIDQDFCRTASSFKSTLTDKGIEQMEKVGFYLGTNHSPSPASYRFITSNMVRARMSAAIVGRSLDRTYPVGGHPRGWSVNALFRERHFGIQNDISSRKKLVLFLDSLEQRQQEPLTWKPLGGDAFDNMIDRVWLAILHLSEHYAGENVFIMTHSWFIWALRYILDGMLPEQFEEEVSNPNNKIQYGDIIHWSSDGPSFTDGYHYSWRKIVHLDSLPDPSNHREGWEHRPLVRKLTTPDELLAGIERYLP